MVESCSIMLIQKAQRVHSKVLGYRVFNTKIKLQGQQSNIANSKLY